MKLLLHICCGPCAIVPVEVLRREGAELMGYFYRHNIHPYTECLKRQQTLSDYAARIDLPLIHQDGYDLEGFIQRMVFRESSRCRACYHDRLRSAALVARRGRFDGYSSTLLYSRFQNHELIQSIGEAVGQDVGIPFVYRDFRNGWKDGIAASKRMGMYRQQYCGCIYSEKERYYHRGKEGHPTP